VAFHRTSFLLYLLELAEGTWPTSAPSGFNNTHRKCKLPTHKLKRRRRFLPIFDEKQDYLVNNRRRFTLVNLQCRRQSFHQLQCCRANLCLHNRSMLRFLRQRMLAKGQHRRLVRPVPLCLRLALITSRSCRSLRQTRCTFSNHQRRNLAYNYRITADQNHPRHPSISTTGCLQHHNRTRAQQADIRQRHPQVNTNLRLLPHTNPVNVRRLMRLTVSTSAPPKSGRPKALTQRNRPQHRHPNPIRHRPSRMYRRHRHQHPDDEDTHEPVQMHLQEVQRDLL
jgi:hypothetical protein